MAGAAQNGSRITGINVTPLVDITLVLLIIFMATAHLIAHRAINLNLPKVAHAQSAPTPSVRVVMTADRTLRLNNVKVTRSELGMNLKRLVQLNPNLHVIVGADRRLSWGDMAGLLDLLRGAGVSKVATEVEARASGRS